MHLQFNVVGGKVTGTYYLSTSTWTLRQMNIITYSERSVFETMNISSALSVSGICVSI